MANTKISQLTANTNPNGWEELVYAYNNANGKMTLNTMKTFVWTGKQDTLVSWTNIKTINNQSILWAWNIDIQWWWWTWADEYDAIVDASWDWDYTTIWAAIDDNKRSLFVRNWTYNETQWHFITMSWVDKLIIHWQSRAWVIVNATLTSVQTQWSDPYNYPALIFLDMRSTDNWDIDVKNITFNISVNSSEYMSYILKLNWKSQSSIDAHISDCIFNVSNIWNERMFFEVLWENSTWTPYWTFDISNCSYVITSDTANMYLETWNRERDNCLFKNCSFLWKANNNNKAYFTIRNAYDCNIRYDKTNMWGMIFLWENIENSYIYLWANVWASIPFDITLNGIRNCEFTCRHSSWYNNKKIWVNSIIQSWAASTSYILWDQVLHDWKFYQCNEAHTSASSWYSDDEDLKWDSVATIFISDAVWCSIETWDTISLWWTIRWNRFDMSYDDGDILVPNRCIIDWNYFEDDSKSRNMYINKHWIVNWNIFGWYAYANTMYIKYVSTEENIITNNIISLLSNISKIWTWTGWVVANNAAWDV